MPWKSKRQMPIEAAMAIIEREMADYKALLAEIKRRRTDALVANALAEVAADKAKRATNARHNAARRANHRRRREARTAP